MEALQKRFPRADVFVDVHDQVVAEKWTRRGVIELARIDVPYPA
jgi:hypothetical protein